MLRYFRCSPKAAIRHSVAQSYCVCCAPLHSTAFPFRLVGMACRIGHSRGGGTKNFSRSNWSQQFEQEITAPQQEHYLSTGETNLGQSEGTEGRRIGQTVL